MYKLVIIVGIVPIIINVFLYILPFKEKGRKGIVTVPKSTFLFFPVIAQFVFGIGLTLCFITYVSVGYFRKDEICTIILCSFVILLSFIPEMYYLKNIVKYDSDKLFYRKKCYYFSDIETFGYDEKNYIFVLKTGKKIKIDRLSIGFDNLYKNYNNFKKSKGAKN